MAEVLSMLDERASRFPNVLSEIDLQPYMSEEQQHRIKPADDYRDEVESCVFGGAIEYGCPLPWPGFRDRFVFRQNELTIWSGYKGHGKSALISQALNAAMVRGKKVFILSPEFRPAKVIERLIYQRTQTRQLGKGQLDEWFSWASKLLWLYDAQKSLKADEVVAICRYVVDRLKVDHILIDSLMKCGMAPDDYGAQKRFVDHIQSIAHLNPVHVHLVAHARKGGSDESPPRLHDIKGTSEIADMAENVICVWRNKPKEKAQSMHDASKNDEPDAMAIVEAQRNADGWIGAVPMFYDRQSMTFFEPKQERDRQEDGEWVSL